jgi:hypothetical protein
MNSSPNPAWMQMTKSEADEQQTMHDLTDENAN